MARRPIAVGEEVTFDYETAATDLLQFRCRCWAVQCRGLIDGTSSRYHAFCRRHAGYLSWYVEQLAVVVQKSGED